MIRYLSISEILELHKRIILETGGAPGLRDFRALESSLSHIKQTFNNCPFTRFPLFSLAPSLTPDL